MRTFSKPVCNFAMYALQVHPSVMTWRTKGYFNKTNSHSLQPLNFAQMHGLFCCNKDRENFLCVLRLDYRRVGPIAIMVENKDLKK